ncbi:hypothetical protein FSP39_011920 [Pinctada imbricata]|uniref:Vacuolar fusion protein MON1 homolog n=1 Tax=Pinctada imbricata TaxID=66713 RepID=A0AA88YNV4_PINIB|nr:hypothetical protein FSP39_011920 [Pinctada imbricata]
MADSKEAEQVSTSESEQSDLIEPETCIHRENSMLLPAENFISIDYESFENYDCQPSGVIHEIVRSNSQDKSEETPDVVLSSSNDEFSAGEDKEERKQISAKELASALTEEDIEEDETRKPEWRAQKKHIFILSEAGKPIYSRHGSEDKLVTIMGVLQALVSFVHDSNKDNIRCIIAGDHKFVFYVRDPLILVCVSQGADSTQQLLLQLTYVYNQVLSVLTHKTLVSIFKQRRNYDLRRLLSGSEKFLDSLLSLIETDYSFLLGAVRCLPLDLQVRDMISQSIIQHARVKDLVFALILANNQLVTLVRMKKYYLHPVDLHLIINLVHASESFKAAESWTPICLPKFDSSGYLQAHISYLDESCQTCLLLLTVDRESFFTLSDCKNKIKERLLKYNGLNAIGDSLTKTSYSINQCGITDLRHFLYKSRSTAQYTSPEVEAPYLGTEEQERLFGLYQYLHHRIHTSARPLKILYHVGPHETLLGWITQGFELYAVFGPLVTKPSAIHSINKLLKWIKREEDRLFILNSVTF